MNKLLIVLLAVCLFSVVSAHTFVKRDAPTAATDGTAPLNAFKDQVTKIGKDFSETISKVMDPEAIKKKTNEFIDGISKAIDSLKPAAGDAKPAPAQ